MLACAKQRQLTFLNRKKPGYDEAPDFFKVRDADGTPVLCHVCQGPAADNRAIIPCSICGLYWHLDCLDPPLAIPPVVRTWRCPAHADELLGGLPESLTPAHRFRKIKDAPVIEQAYSRGMKNNGFIEVDDDESDEDSGWKDFTSFGRVYKLPAKGIMLDFISQSVWPAFHTIATLGHFEANCLLGCVSKELAMFIRVPPRGT